MTGVCLTVLFGPLARRLLLVLTRHCLFRPVLLMCRRRRLFLFLIHPVLLLPRLLLFSIRSVLLLAGRLLLQLFLVLLIDRRLLVLLLLLALDLLVLLLDLFFARGLLLANRFVA